MSRMIGVDGQYTGILQEKSLEYLNNAADSLKNLQSGNCSGAEFTSWYHWPKNQGFELLQQIEHWKSGYDTIYDTVVVCGIGGSYAGTLAVEQALNHSHAHLLEGTGKNQGKKSIMYAGHNLSETGLIELLDALELKLPIINIISKSGTTTEPSVAFRVLYSYLQERFGKEEAKQRIVVTTDTHKGVLRELANENRFPSFSIPDGVGGRFSILTAVGMVPLCLAGYPVEELTEGADVLFTSLDPENLSSEHPCLQLAATRRAAWDQGKTIDILSYGEPKLNGLVEWWKQLFGESEGKEGKGLFPAGMIYSTDLHSLGQFLQEGNPCILETFLFIDSQRTSGNQVEKRLKVPSFSLGDDKLQYLEGKYISEISTAAMKAALEAHSERGVPCISLSIPSLSPYYIGQMLAFFEVVCAVSALLLDVNPFNQEGVEAYKTNLFRIMGRPGFK
ncbi:MAG: glucose-6-phosphate isomerase [Oligoflexales bacterium]